MKTFETGTQKRLILDALLSGRQLSSNSGFFMGIVRLTARIWDLRKLNVPISERWEVSDKKKRYKVFYMTIEARKAFKIIQ